LVIVRKLPDLIDTISWDYDEKIKLHLKEQIVSDSKSMNSKGLVYFFFSLKEDSNKVSYKYALYNPETRILFSIGKKQFTFQEDKMLRDIPHMASLIEPKAVA
jgi:hypothetical protein